MLVAETIFLRITRTSEHDPETLKPVFGKDHVPTGSRIGFSRNGLKGRDAL
jgi:hypothetical protein